MSRGDSDMVSIVVGAVLLMVILNFVMPMFSASVTPSADGITTETMTMVQYLVSIFPFGAWGIVAAVFLSILIFGGAFSPRRSYDYSYTTTDESSDVNTERTIKKRLNNYTIKKRVCSHEL